MTKKIITSVIVNNNKVEVSNNFFQGCASLREVVLPELPYNSSGISISFNERAVQINSEKKEYKLENQKSKKKKKAKVNYLQVFTTWLLSLLKREQVDSGGMPLPNRSRLSPQKYEEQLNLWFDNQIATKTE